MKITFTKIAHSTSNYIRFLIGVNFMVIFTMMVIDVDEIGISLSMVE